MEGLNVSIEVLPQSLYLALSFGRLEYCSITPSLNNQTGSGSSNQQFHLWRCDEEACFQLLLIMPIHRIQWFRINKGKDWLQFKSSKHDQCCVCVCVCVWLKLSPMLCSHLVHSGKFVNVTETFRLNYTVRNSSSRLAKSQVLSTAETVCIRLCDPPLCLNAFRANTEASLAVSPTPKISQIPCRSGHELHAPTQFRPPSILHTHEHEHKHKHKQTTVNTF